MEAEKLLAAGIALLATTMAWAPSAAAQGRTLVVDDDGVQCPEAGFESIQAAEDDAVAGDTVAVCRGVYDEALTIDTPSITVCGAVADGPACGFVCGQVVAGCEEPSTRVTVDATDTSANVAVRIQVGDVTLDGLTVVAGVAQSGVRVGGGNALLANNEIVSTATDEEADVRTIGVDVVAGTATVTDNRIAGWIANAVGVWRADARIVDNVFAANRVGVHLSPSAEDARVDGNAFAGHLWPVRVAGPTPELGLSDNELGPSNAFALRIEPDVDGLQLDAPDNWWGALGCAAIQERVDDPEGDNAIDVTPYRGPTGNVLGGDGLLDPSAEDPTCEA